VSDHRILYGWEAYVYPWNVMEILKFCVDNSLTFQHRYGGMYNILAFPAISSDHHDKLIELNPLNPRKSSEEKKVEEKSPLLLYEVRLAKNDGVTILFTYANTPLEAVKKADMHNKEDQLVYKAFVKVLSANNETAVWKIHDCKVLLYERWTNGEWREA